MKHWQRICVSPTADIKTAIAAIDVGCIGLALVVAEDYRLLGTITDGDIRRGLLRDIVLSDVVTTIMNADPTVVKLGATSGTVLRMMQQLKLQQIPIVDDQGRLVDVETLGSQLQTRHQDNPVVIMAGGFGTRLAPLTKSTPKPMLKIASKPLLEILLEQLKTAGFKQFYFATHHQADIIREYFHDGEDWGVQIDYLHELSPMGTAGALSLLPPGIDKPILVMNGDIMTQINFHQLLHFHEQQQAAATLCVREYRQSIPYGVVELDNNKLKSLTEKPSQQYFVNAGIYLLEPWLVSRIAKDKPTDMPDLLSQVVAEDHAVSVFPIREYWLDIGHLDNFEQAQTDYKELFDVSTT